MGTPTSYSNLVHVYVKALFAASFHLTTSGSLNSCSSLQCMDLSARALTRGDANDIAIMQYRNKLFCTCYFCISRAGISTRGQKAVVPLPRIILPVSFDLAAEASVQFVSHPHYSQCRCSSPTNDTDDSFLTSPPKIERLQLFDYPCMHL